MKPTLVIMAAGMGSRYGGIKQIDPIGPSGEAIIEYSVYDALREGFGRIVFIIRKAIDAEVKDFIRKRFQDTSRLDFVYQELDDLPGGFTVPGGRSKPWGTGQAVLCARSAVSGPFAIINADDFYGRDAYRVMARFLSSVDSAVPEFSMVGYRLDKTLSENGSVSRGVCSVNEKGYLISVEEFLKIERRDGGLANADENASVTFTGAEIVSMNMFGFTPALFPLLEEKFLGFLRNSAADPKSEFYIPRVVGELVREGMVRVKVLPSSASWFGITYREDKPLVAAKIRDLVAEKDYPGNLRD